jgi:hypothetical protein
LNETNALWHNLLIHRYGPLVDCFLLNDALVPNGKTSLWWHDIKSGGESDSGWFSVSNILGDGNTIKFWKEKWFGMNRL